MYVLNRSKKKTLFLGISGAGLSIPLLFSSREGLVHREKSQSKKPYFIETKMAAFNGQLSARTSSVGTVPRRGPGEAATRRAAAARGGAGAPGARLGATARGNEWTAVDRNRASRQQRQQRVERQEERASALAKKRERELLQSGRGRRVAGRVWRVPQGTVRPDEMCFLC